MNRERIHVLLVEDEDAHAELIRRAFEPRSDVIRLSVAKNLQEARASLTESLPDLAIVDLFLPDGRGLELLEGPTEGPDYPVVIVTSQGDEQAAVDAMKAGALQYVVKSEVTLAQLPHKVDTALRQWGHIVERKQAEEALQANEQHFRSLARELTEVLAPMVEDSSSALREIPEGSCARPELERVVAAAARARRLAEQIFTLSSSGSEES